MRILFSILTALYLANAQASAPVPILVVHSYSQEYPWTKGENQGFIQALNDDASRTYIVTTEYLDTKRTGYGEAYAELTAEYFREKYRGYQPAAIYVSDDNALSFALSHLGRLFPRAPVFFSGINDLAVRSRLDPSHATGVFEQKNIEPNLQLIRDFDPAVRDIVIVGDASETYRAIESHIRASMERYPGIRATYVSDGRIDALVERLRKCSERFVVLTTLGAFKGDDGHTLTPAEAIQAIAGAGRFVLISMEDAYVRPGVLGGYTTSGPSQGHAAAQLLERYLDGTPVAELTPLETSPNEYVINEIELSKSGLRLPERLEGRVKLVNRAPSFYESNRVAIVGALYGLAILLLISVIGWVLFLRKNRQIAQVKESLVHAQHIARIGNWEWRVGDDRVTGSEQAYRLLGLDPVETGVSYEAFIAHVHPDDRDAVRQAARRAVQAGAAYDFDHRIAHPDGKVRYIHQSAELVRDRNAVRMIGTVQDVTERKLAEQALRQKDAHLNHLAYHDPLTDLPNRALLIDQIAHGSKRADRNGSLMALLFIDLDRFKTINDSLGHTVGDTLLQSAAMRIKQVVRDSDTVSRFGGDEFMVLLENVKDRDGIILVVRKVLEALDSPFDIEGHHLHVSGSIGISIYPADGKDAATLIRNADAAMYRAKDTGRNNFHFYENSITERVAHRMRMESRLRTAFEQERLEVFYQPLVELQSGRICGAEALLRWNDPEEGAIPPDDFIPLAEETGLILPLGEWVVRQACLAAQAWRGRLGLRPDFAVHVNLSAKQLAQKDLPQRLRAILDDTGMNPGGLMLELTEGIITGSEADGQTVLAGLRDLGVGIGIDDFGTGHSSLSRLKQLPISELKIDRSFIRDISDDAGDKAIVQAILALARSLGLRVVAEGVEEPGQEAYLIKQGCDLAQGYYYGRPMPQDQLLCLLLEEQAFTAGQPPRARTAAQRD